MSWQAGAEAYGSIVGAVGVVGGLIAGMRKRYSDKAQQEVRERAELEARKFSEGVHSRDDEVRLVTSERDAARDEAKDAKADAQRWQQAYIELTRRRGG